MHLISYHMVMRAHTQSLNVPTGEDINCPVGISVQSFKFILIGGGKGFLVDIRTTHHFLLTMTVQMFCFVSVNSGQSPGIN